MKELFSGGRDMKIEKEVLMEEKYLTIEDVNYGRYDE